MLTNSRKVVATFFRSTGPSQQREAVWSRRYSWMDTAMPRAVQLLMTEGVPGDVVEFSSAEHGFQLGVLRVLPRGKFDLEMSPLVKASPALLRLMESPK